MHDYMMLHAQLNLNAVLIHYIFNYMPVLSSSSLHAALHAVAIHYIQWHVIEWLVTCCHNKFITCCCNPLLGLHSHLCSRLSDLFCRTTFQSAISVQSLQHVEEVATNQLPKPIENVALNSRLPHRFGLAFQL
jgi:hypothetical protein